MCQSKVVVLVFGVLFWITSFSHAQNPDFTPFKSRINNGEILKTLDQNSLVHGIPIKNVGPTVMSGRVTDIEVNPENPKEFFVAYASGGLWKTTNNGHSYEPLFDKELVISIGDIAINWKNKNEIWLGSGENNSSRSSYSGLGIYKSEDGGKTWVNKGLPESHHVGRIITHPDKPEIVYVAVCGHLYSENKERGIYKTTDGGQTWNQVLYVNEFTSGIDMAFQPGNPETIYAAMWEKDRKAWDFKESGSGSGVYKSSDAGNTWKKLVDGLPNGDHVGRMGIGVCDSSPDDVYVVVDNQLRRPKETESSETGELTKHQLKEMESKAFIELPDSIVNLFLRQNNFPKKYNSKSVKDMVNKGKIKVSSLYEYLTDANAKLFDTPVTGMEIYRSKNAGKNWEKTHDDYLDDVFFSYGYYFGQIRVNPSNKENIYILGVPAIYSEDGGKTFKSFSHKNVHVDHHALWINPKDAKHIILGNDGGINVSYDNGVSWNKTNTPAVGQFYTVAVDNATPFNIYGGLQDNGVWVGPSTYSEENNWISEGEYAYKRLLGGDGMQICIDTVRGNNQIVYTGYQFGNYFRINRNTGQMDYITPSPELGDRPYRFNWQSPIHLSSHNQDILYLGGNYMHRSMDGGKSFKTLGKDLTKGGKPGDVAYGTLTTIHESELQFGLVYVGTDDGKVWRSSNAGQDFTDISKGLPENMWVSRIFASPHDVDKVYLSLNGYRWDNFKSMVYWSKDKGNSWKPVEGQLPNEPVNVIKEDPKKAGVLYVGTDNGLYISMNNGKSFMTVGADLPKVAVHDLVIHPRDKKLVIGTHGRSIYLMDVEILQSFDDSLTSLDLQPLQTKPVKHQKSWGTHWSKWLAKEKDNISLPFWSKTSGEVKLNIYHSDSVLITQKTMNVNKGFNYFNWSLGLTIEEFEKVKETTGEIKQAGNGLYYLKPGSYRCEWIKADHKIYSSFIINPK